MAAFGKARGRKGGSGRKKSNGQVVRSHLIREETREKMPRPMSMRQPLSADPLWTSKLEVGRREQG